MSKSLGNASIRSRCSTATAPTRCGGASSRAARRGSSRRVVDGGLRRDRPPVPAHPVERLRVLRHVRERADGFDPAHARARARRAPGDRPMDRAPSSIGRSTRRAAASRPTTRPARAARIEAFVDDLSNWYVRAVAPPVLEPGRRARRRCEAAFHTLHECLVTVAKLLAPFTPFVAEELWRNLAAGRDGRPDSVHLATYPEPDARPIDDALDAAMARRATRSSSSAAASASRRRRGSASRCAPRSSTSRARETRSRDCSRSSPTS